MIQNETDIVNEALDLMDEKSEDYNSNVKRSEYFPFGLKSYAHMINLKAKRIVNVSDTENNTNFESLRDSCLDLINYTVMMVQYINETENNK